MGILDGIVEWIAEQVMAGLDLVTTSVLGALGCDMAVFLRYFPAAETMYSVFVALAIGIILLNWVWQLFKNFGLGAGVCAARCTGLHGSCGFFHGRQPDHSKHLEILVPDAWRSNFPIGHERLVPAPVHKHGGVLPCEPAFVVRRSYP